MSEKQPFDPIVPVRYHAESENENLQKEGEKAFNLARPIDASSGEESEKPYALPHKREDLTAMAGLKRVLSSITHAPDAMDRRKSDKAERKEGKRVFKKRLKADLKEARNMRNAVDNANTAMVYGNGGRGEVVEDFDPEVIPIGRRRRQYVRNERRMAKRLQKAEKIRPKLEVPSKASSAEKKPTQDITEQNDVQNPAEQAERQEKLVEFINDGDTKAMHILGVLLSGRRLHETTIQSLLSDRKHDATHAQAMEKIQYLKDHGVLKDFVIDKYYQAAINEEELEAAMRQAEAQSSRSTDSKVKPTTKTSKTERITDTDVPLSDRLHQAAADRLRHAMTNDPQSKPQQPVAEGEIVAEQATPQPEEEIYDIEYVEDAPEASEPQKDAESEAKESESENTEFKSNTGIGVEILQSLSKEISHSVSDTVRATKQERNLGKDDKLPREDFESILNNAVEVNIKDWLVKTGLASKEETIKLNEMFEHIKTDLENFRKFSDQEQAKQEKKSLRQREQEAAQAVADNAARTAIES